MYSHHLLSYNPPIQPFINTRQPLAIYGDDIIMYGTVHTLFVSSKSPICCSGCGLRMHSS